MPKGIRNTATKRQPTYEELDDAQRKFYDELSTDEQRAKFLGLLPPVSSSMEQSKRKAQVLRSKAMVMQQVVDAFAERINQMNQLAEALEQGRDAKQIDLRRETVPPTIPGVFIRFARSKDSTEE